MDDGRRFELQLYLMLASMAGLLVMVFALASAETGFMAAITGFPIAVAATVSQIRDLRRLRRPDPR
ncbi:putative integral membrane protein [Nocardiopsis mwathae]|uniref:Putative integral membrane protein n=1 Tax=Nocardiopsis mwathae TaxID=1472723 RepID=A0A7W9YDI1_9ACTN|nr:hypothetical protein [Nocardiopsis mwathae]MBB6170122.1 putative integral membrane protein [Nocardiopsis mwathae]